MPSAPEHPDQFFIQHRRGDQDSGGGNPCEETDFPVVVPEQERNGKDAGGNDRQMIQKRLEDEYPSGISEQIVEAAEQA